MRSGDRSFFGETDLGMRTDGVRLHRADPGRSVSEVFHPHDVAGKSEADWHELERLAADPAVVAIGEIGLDYYRDRAPRDVQAAAFRRQIPLARRLGKPLAIHSRDAFADTLRILVEERAGEIGGLFHCFSGTTDEARAVLDLGFQISIAGPLTYPKSRLPEVARDISRLEPGEATLGVVGGLLLWIENNEAVAIRQLGPAGPLVVVERRLTAAMQGNDERRMVRQIRGDIDVHSQAAWVVTGRA